MVLNPIAGLKSMDVIGTAVKQQVIVDGPKYRYWTGCCIHHFLLDPGQAKVQKRQQQAD